MTLFSDQSRFQGRNGPPELRHIHTDEPTLHSAPRLWLELRHVVTVTAGIKLVSKGVAITVGSALDLDGNPGSFPGRNEIPTNPLTVQDDVGTPTQEQLLAGDLGVRNTGAHELVEHDRMQYLLPAAERRRFCEHRSE